MDWGKVDQALPLSRDLVHLQAGEWQLSFVRLRSAQAGDWHSRVGMALRKRLRACIACSMPDCSEQGAEAASKRAFLAVRDGPTAQNNPAECAICTPAYHIVVVSINTSFMPDLIAN